MKKNIAILILVVLVLSMASTALLFHNVRSGERIINENTTKVDSPIRINNDSDLQNMAANNGWPGDGTELNPYVIENYNIDVGSARNGIYIGNTTLHFIIRNSEIYNVSGSISNSGEGAAIALVTAHNITIENVYIHESKYYGIYMSNSVHITVKNNRIENNTLASTSYGVYVSAGSDVEVRDNFLYTTTLHATGVYFHSFYYGRIINNTITHFRDNGIYLHYSSHTTLWSNKMYECSIMIAGSTEEGYNHTIPLNNTVNNMPVYYYLDKDFNNAPIPLPKDVGELILANVSNAIVENMNISGTSTSYVVGESNNIRMKNISASDTGSFSLYVVFSDNVTVENSLITQSYSTGVYIYMVNDVMLSNITISWCSSSGLFFYYSYRVDIFNVTLSHDYYGMSIYNDYNMKNQYTHIENSKFENMTQYNTKFTYALNIEVNNSHFANGGIGVWLYDYNHNSVVTNNTFYNLVSLGIESDYSNNVRIENNTIVDCGNSAIYLWYQRNTHLAYNYIDNPYGIQMRVVNDSIIMNNTVKNSNNYGIEIYGGTAQLGSNILVGNLIENSSSYGIYLNGTKGNLIYNNTLKYNNGATDSYDPSHVQAWDDTPGNFWNTSGTPHGYGNYWSDWTSPDSNGDGIVDNPYVIDGGSGAQDYYPRASSPYIPEFQLLYLTLIIIGISLMLIRRKQ